MDFLAVTLFWVLTSLNYEVGSSIYVFFNPYTDITKVKSVKVYKNTGHKFGSCGTISPLPCENITVSLPLNLSFNQSVSNTITDKNNQGTGFTMVDAYSGTRLSADGIPENSGVPGHQRSKLTSFCLALPLQVKIFKSNCHGFFSGNPFLGFNFTKL